MRVAGVELERAPELDRLLVLASGELQATLEEPSPEELLLRLTDATLDARAARQLVSGTSDSIRDVRISARAGPPPVVEIRARHAAGLHARLSRRGTILALEVAHPPEPKPEPRAAAATVRLNLRDRPLVELVREVQRITQRPFVWDDRLQGTATVIIQEPVTPGEALEILQATLQAKGFAAVPGPDDALLVLPLDEARARAPRVTRALEAERAALITLFTRFRSANAEQLVNLLAPFAGATLQVIAYAPTNGAILVGPENALQRWLGLARSLDETSRREIAVIRPRYRTAAELDGLLSESLLDPLTGRARAELFLDERTNALLLRGEPAELASVRAQIAELDVAPEAESAVLVIRPRFADAEQLMAQLEAFGNARPGEAPLHVVLHKSTRSLLVEADAATQRELRELVDSLDVPPPLIALEAQLLEVATTGQLALGIDAFIPSTDPSNPGRTIFGAALGDPFDQSPDPLAASFLARYARTPVVIPVLGPGGVPVGALTLPRDIVQLKAASGEARVRSLMQPRLMTLSGEEHEFSAGLNLPIPTASSASAQGRANASDPLATHLNIERKDVGLRLRMKPVAGEAGDVRISVDLDVAGVQPSAAGARSDVGPELTHRTLKATTSVADGGAAVLGMLLERGLQTSETGAPVLKDAPVLGNLLKQTFDQNGARTLILTLQARLLRSPDERLADTIRLRSASERASARGKALAADGSAWALRVATRTLRADADSLAASLGEVAGRRARVVSWRADGAERFDVVVSGFADVRAAAGALPALDALGWQAELVALPKRDAPSD